MSDLQNLDAYGLRWQLHWGRMAAPDVRGNGYNVINVIGGDAIVDPLVGQRNWIESPAIYSTRRWDAGDDPVLRLAVDSKTSDVRFRYRDHVEFIVKAGGRELIAASALGIEHVLPYLMGSVAAYVLRQRGVASLHGSGLLMQEGAALICGNSGFGKSTLSAALVGRGFPLISDDVCPIVVRDEAACTFQGSTRMRLWPDALRALGLDPELLARVHSNFEKRFVVLSTPQCVAAGASCPVRSVYILRRVARTDRPFSVQQLWGASAIAALVGQSYLAYVAGTNESPSRAAEFHALGALARRAQVFELTVAEGLDNVLRVADCLSSATL